MRYELLNVVMLRYNLVFKRVTGLIARDFSECIVGFKRRGYLSPNRRPLHPPDRIYLDCQKTDTIRVKNLRRHEKTYV